MGCCQPSQTLGRRRRWCERRNGSSYSDPRSGGLVSAKAQPRVPIEPDGKPSAGWFVVQNNGVAKGIGKWAWPLALVRRVKVMPPSVEHDTPEKLLGLHASRIVEGDAIWSGLSGLAVVYVSD